MYWFSVSYTIEEILSLFINFDDFSKKNLLFLKFLFFKLSKVNNKYALKKLDLSFPEFCLTVLIALLTSPSNTNE